MNIHGCSVYLFKSGLPQMVSECGTKMIHDTYIGIVRRNGVVRGPFLCVADCVQAAKEWHDSEGMLIKPDQLIPLPR